MSSLGAQVILLVLSCSSSPFYSCFIFRNDKLGVPFTVIVNDSTLETGAISLRNRDTTIRVRIFLSHICATAILSLRTDRSGQTV